jgi:anti-anti-sigma regulatory factor
MASHTELNLPNSAVPEPFRAKLHELSGECDLASVGALRASLADAEDAARGGAGLVLDVSRLTYCDVRSAGLILQTSTAVRTLPSGADGIVKRVFDLTDLTSP